MFADVRRLQRLTDGNGDAYYGGSMYYGSDLVPTERTWCGYRDCSPYEWRREEQEAEAQLWESATPKGSAGMPNLPLTPMTASSYF